MTSSPIAGSSTDTPKLADNAISALLKHLAERGYRFVTPNRGVHRQIRGRRDAVAEHVYRDVFGWVRPVARGVLPADLERQLLNAGVLIRVGDQLRSTIRVSSVDDLLFVHSTPDAGRDAVFLGPDSYRYARFLDQTLRGGPPAATAVDIGVGAGVGALTLARKGFADVIVGTDVNAEALRFTRLNAQQARLPVTLHHGPGLPGGSERFDLIIANPPFIAGGDGATYRDGGDAYGSSLALEWSEASLKRLNPGGRFVLYTGAPIVEGIDIVQRALSDYAADAGLPLRYDEIDPDIFGGLLGTASYQDVERIAAVGAVMGPA